MWGIGTSNIYSFLEVLSPCFSYYTSTVVSSQCSSVRFLSFAILLLLAKLLIGGEMLCTTRGVIRQIIALALSKKIVIWITSSFLVRCTPLFIHVAFINELCAPCNLYFDCKWGFESFFTCNITAY